MTFTTGITKKIDQYISNYNIQSEVNIIRNLCCYFFGCYQIIIHLIVKKNYFKFCL